MKSNEATLTKNERSWFPNSVLNNSPGKEHMLYAVHTTEEDNKQNTISTLYWEACGKMVNPKSNSLRKKA